MARVSNWCGGRGRRRARDGWMEGICWEQTDWEVKLKADGRAGTCRTLKSVWSRFPHVFFFSASSACYAKNRHSQVLTLCDHALPELFAHNGMPHPYKTPLKSFHSVSPSPGKQTEVAFSTGESVVKAWICGPRAAQQPADPKKHTGTHRFVQLPLWVFLQLPFTSHSVYVHSCFWDLGTSVPTNH